MRGYFVLKDEIGLNPETRAVSAPWLAVSFFIFIPFIRITQKIFPLPLLLLKIKVKAGTV